MIGLRIPTDLDAWQRWRGRKTPLRTLKSRIRSQQNAGRFAWINTDEPPRAAVGVAATTASGRAALVAPLEHLGATPTIVYSDQAIDHLLPGWRRTPADFLPSIRAVLADGHYLGLGYDLWLFARELDLPYFIVQHGLITPLAPPLAPGGTLLAWSAADAAFWRCDRPDVAVEVVGSQLLWNAADGRGRASSARTPTEQDHRLIYLGQGHAVEIPRRRTVEAAMRFCRRQGATYRPHPSERDRLSRVTLNAYQRAGILVEADGRPLADLPNPVVSVFSTGVLEAAARGRDAWVDFPRPPSWLEEFWERYGMYRFGSIPTPAPPRPENEPACKIAAIVSDAVS